MEASLPNLRLLDHSAATRELDQASELFHRINRIIPQDQVVAVPLPERVGDDKAAAPHAQHLQAR